MTLASRPTSVTARKGEPTWEIATLFPSQGHWSVEEYLDLRGNHLVEYCDGFIEVLPMPTMRHQLIVRFLLQVLNDLVERKGMGRVLFAPFRIRLSPRQFREPDLMIMRTGNEHRVNNEYWEGADLVVEVVSEDGRQRDLEIKRTEYARAGIPEYWIVDPQQNTVTVLTLADTTYKVHGEFRAGQQADSVLFPGLAVDVDSVFAVR